MVGITGNALRQDIEYYLDEGADDVISKPLLLADLEKAIEDARHRAETLGHYISSVRLNTNRRMA